MAHMSPDKLMRLKFPLSRRTRTNYACMPSFLGRKTHRPTFFLLLNAVKDPVELRNHWISLYIYNIFYIYIYSWMIALLAGAWKGAKELGVSKNPS